MPSGSDIVQLEQDIFSAVERYGSSAVIGVVVAICALLMIAALFWKILRQERNNQKDRSEERKLYADLFDRIGKNQDASIRELSEQTRMIAQMAEKRDEYISQALQRIETTNKEVRETTTAHIQDSRERYSTVNRLTAETSVDVKEIVRMMTGVGVKLDTLVSAVEHHAVGGREVKSEVVAAREEFRLGIKSILDAMKGKSGE